MTDSKIVVHGAERLAATLAKAGRALGKMTGANRSVAMAIAQRSRAGAPKRSGKLARSTTGKDMPNNGARVQATVIYAGVIHYGWRRHRISPHPYVSDTVHQLEGTWVNKYAEETQKIMDNVKGV